MKRIMAALAIALTMSFTMTSCWRGCSRTEPSPVSEQRPNYAQDFIGTWELIGMIQAGDETTQQELEDMRSRGLAGYLDLMEDATATLDIFGTVMDGTWEASSQGVGTMTIQGQSISMELDNELLVLSQEASELTMKRIDPADKIEPQDITSTFVADGASAYYGGNTIDELEDVRELDVTIADDDVCTIKAIAMGMYDGDPGVLFEVTNNSGTDVLVSDNHNDWSINGSYYLITMYETVRSGETLGTIAWFEADDVGASTDSILGTSGVIYVLDAQDPSQEISHYEFTL